ncbi:hypothetical protein GQ42DRAFT_176859 [Ramicandelaber brevisporus]|nr:hypothetical protein GQ42DRAFT_176859 [Ramicandelaber brevisporus]
MTMLRAIVSRVSRPSTATTAATAAAAASRSLHGIWSNSSATALPSSSSFRYAALRFASLPASRIRNLGIVAHVDHGKSSLVDCFLRQAGVLAAKSNPDGDGPTERVMDSNTLEKERGITILSKVTSIDYKDHRINIVDTPGHADFGGEVERIMSMLDGVVLVVDATEGPMAQTRFVLQKALANPKLMPVVYMNKIDRPTARPNEVDSEILDLFMTLGASEEQMDYPLLFGSAKEGWSSRNIAQGKDGIYKPESASDDSMIPLLDAIVERVPAPSPADREKPFRMLVTQVDSNPFLGKSYIGRIIEGTIKVGDPIRAIIPSVSSRQEIESNPGQPLTGSIAEEGRCTKIFFRRGLEQLTTEEAGAGDIITITGLQNAGVNATICSPQAPTDPLPFVPVDPPTVSMSFSVNDSPLGGQEGTIFTSAMIRDRLLGEIETNVALTMNESKSKDSFEVCGRGELQLGVLIETMRREGFELSISPPKVLFKRDEKTGDLMEPIEEVTIDVDHAHAGLVIEKMAPRKGELKSYTDAPMANGQDSADRARLVFHVPTRGLLGFAAEFKNETHGTGVINHVLHAYEPHRGPLERTRKPSLISMSSGSSTAYALRDIEPRGRLFVGAQEKVYPGMVIGEYNKDGSGDLEVNPTKAKQLSNVRTVMKDDAIRLAPPKNMTLEQVIAFVAEDEVIEVTPKSVRLRKRILDSGLRKKESRKKTDSAAL